MRWGVVILGLCTLSCTNTPSKPAIQFTQLPEAGIGGPKQLQGIAGTVTAAQPGQQIILYAKAGTWWIQPFARRFSTTIQPDQTWANQTHLGSDYAALLVDSTYKPKPNIKDLPAPGNGVVAIAIAPGKPGATADAPKPHYVSFSGYEWLVTQTPIDNAGVLFDHRLANVNVDTQGQLHLRISREGSKWTCSDVKLPRPLGYGDYSFWLDLPKPLEPAAVFRLNTWDEDEAGQNHREIDIELSQWGDPAAKNAQFVIQPYYVPANSFRFQLPAGPSRHSFRWRQGSVEFRTEGATTASHRFTSGVPDAGAESVHMQFCVYGKSRVPQQSDTEVIIRKFEFLP